MHPLRSESMGMGWSTIVNFTAVTTVLRERGDPGKTIHLHLHLQPNYVYQILNV